MSKRTAARSLLIPLGGRRQRRLGARMSKRTAVRSLLIPLGGRRQRRLGALSVD